MKQTAFKYYFIKFFAVEPIAIDPKTATVPIIDNFRHDTFEYHSGGDGSRGVFDWNFIYHWLAKRPEDLLNPEKPSPLPVNHFVLTLNLFT